MDKKIKKRTKLRILPIIIIVLVIVFIIGSVYLFSLVPIKNIYIKGNNYLSDQTLIELANIEDYPSFLKTSSSSIIKKIKKNPYIKKVTVKKKLFASIYIEVEEKKVLFKKEEDNVLVLDDKSEVIGSDNYQVPMLINYIPDTKYDSFINGMNKITDDVISQISEIRYYPNEQDDDRFLLYMNDGNYVYLTLTKFKQINYYDDVLEKLDGKKGILYLDSGNHFKVME